jgi:hypothetical protein
VLGVLHVCDANGDELSAGETGEVYVEREDVPFVYHNDPAKTKASQHPRHPDWTTMGDIGYLDEDDYLYLTDRASFMIISGGVNIYPQEIENVLALHPAIHDVAVIGVPDPEMGESVKAFVQAAVGAEPGPELEREILAFVKSRIAGFKAPRIVEFVDDLPRTETGKLVKGELRKRSLSALVASHPREQRMAVGRSTSSATVYRGTRACRRAPGSASPASPVRCSCSCRPPSANGSWFGREFAHIAVRCLPGPVGWPTYADRSGNSHPLRVLEGRAHTLPNPAGSPAVAQPI